MATAYTPILQLALPVTGELNGTWGDVVNNNITSMVEQAIAGLATVSTWTAASHTLTTANGTTDEARCAVLECSGAPGAAATVICPAFSKVYIIKNSVTGGYAVTLKTSGGAGISVPNGTTALLYCDGTNVVSGANVFTTLTNTGTAYLGGASGNHSLQINNVASAVNYLQIDGAVSGSSPTLSAQGTGSNISILLTPKGAGNVGISATPAAWGSGWVVAQLGLGGGVVGRTANSSAYVTSNMYFDGTNYKYINTDFASYYRQFNGNHYFYSAPSGTAGATATIESILELVQAGNLRIPNGQLEVSLLNNTSKGAITPLLTDATNGGLIFKTELAGTLTERMRINSTGLVTIGDPTLPAGTTVLLNALFSSDTATGNVFSVRKSAATTAGANIGAFRSRGTAAAPTALTSGDNISSFASLGFDGTNYLTASSIISAVDGAVSAGVIYGRISFLTNNGTTNAERGRVDNTGIWTFAGATGTQTLQVNPTASSVNWIQVSGGATGVSPTVLAGGSDSNIDLKLSTTGTGVLQFGTYTAGTVSQAGYITIKDAGGTSRRLLVG